MLVTRITLEKTLLSSLCKFESVQEISNFFETFCAFSNVIVVPEYFKKIWSKLVAELLKYVPKILQIILSI